MDTSAGSPKKILKALLVEDDVVDVRIVRAYSGLLSEYELDITHVADSAAAKTALKCQHFDLCLVDYWLEHGTSAGFISLVSGSDGPAVVLLSSITQKEAQNLGVGSWGMPFLYKGSLTPAGFEAILRNIVH